MKVYVKLFAFFTKTISEAVLTQHPGGIRAGIPIEVELSDGSTLQNLVDYLALPRDHVKITFVNGKAQKLDRRLEPGDQIGIFPPVGGG